MDESLKQQLNAAFALATLRESNEVGLRIGRQSDGMQIDNRAVTAGVFAAIIQGDDPQFAQGVNLSARVPTTLEHPGYVVGPGTSKP